MGPSRRFLNLIMDNRIPGFRSLYCIDPKRFFDTRTNANGSERLQNSSWVAAVDSGYKKNNKAVDAALKMEPIQLPNPIFNFGASRSDPNADQWKIHCLPLVDRRMICADQYGRCFLFEADTRRVVTMPHLHRPKSMPISLYIPNLDMDDYAGGCRGTIFIMERVPKPQADNQFEAFVYRKHELSRFSKAWDCLLLPPPPYVQDAMLCDPCPEISSYGVIDDGSHIFISVEGVGTYFLNTESHTWSDVRKWTLPFHGKVEYAPELKLWFGLSANAQVLAVANLSMDSQPQLVGDCKEVNLPEEWKQCYSQLVNLGSNKFCVARFFNTNGDSSNELVEQNMVVLTGMEVDHAGICNNGKVGIRMIPRKSECHSSNGSCAIQAVF